MNGKALTVLNARSLVKVLSDYGCLKHRKKIVFVTDSVVQNFPEAEVQKKVNLVY